ncbi:unnamed protein product [Polarella glacialis]|uniref:Uncharacterized protein n=1 Tax=Polarella glacialis TaxID=89957 RepID=A0A813EDS9_POLGL|nr:unnamed protein product [Polarella glacialis]
MWHKSARLAPHKGQKSMTRCNSVIPNNGSGQHPVARTNAQTLKDFHWVLEKLASNNNIGKSQGVCKNSHTGQSALAPAASKAVWSYCVRLGDTIVVRKRRRLFRRTAGSKEAASAISSPSHLRISGKLPKRTRRSITAVAQQGKKELRANNSNIRAGLVGGSNIIRASSMMASPSIQVPKRCGQPQHATKACQPPCRCPLIPKTDLAHSACM